MPMAVPMPTLYNGETKKPKLSIIELVLYNIAAMLAGVATGYDVRMSNISPIHPRLYPRPGECENEPPRWWFQADTGSNRNSGYLGPDYEFSSTSGYPHNTYHGPARHYRYKIKITSLFITYFSSTSIRSQTTTVTITGHS